MDLMRFWEARRKSYSETMQAARDDDPAPVLVALADRLQQDLTLLTHVATVEQRSEIPRAVETFRVVTGAFQKPGPRVVWDKEKPNRPLDYVFLQVPGKPGILLTHEGGQTILCERATRVIPEYTEDDGSRALMTLFVTRKPTLEELRVLDPVTLRTSDGRTVSIHQLSELVLSFALEQV